MSKIKNGGLDQYGKVESCNGIGGERVKCCPSEEQCCRHLISVYKLITDVFIQ